MPLSAATEARLAARRNNTAPRTRRGDQIFDGTDYPSTWAGFIGQTAAKEHLQAAVRSALHRTTRLEHTLLASGLAGIGKTTLAHLLAYQHGAGMVSISGPVTVEEARPILLSLTDGDIVFWDEFHLAVVGNRNRADWVLPVLTGDGLLTSAGAEKIPDVTFVAATTDVGKLPLTVTSRFMCKPKIVGYSDVEAVMLVRNLSDRMGICVDPSEEPRIARAANNNPRDMRMILTAARDVAYTGAYSLEKAFAWAGMSHDGIPTVAQEMLLLLLTAKDQTMSIDSIAASLGEPGPLRHYEQVLMQKGMVAITGRGRKLTDEGAVRAELLARERTT
jgi:holliday junction DNA helicase RuvB